MIRVMQLENYITFSIPALFLATHLVRKCSEKLQEMKQINNLVFQLGLLNARRDIFIIFHFLG